MIQLRPYQEHAVSKMIWDIQNPGNSVVCLPQGSGKSLVIAAFAHRLGKPILILQPSKELLEQNVEKILHYVGKDEIGIFSASKNRKDVNTFTFGTIQSVYKHPELFSNFNIAIVDEADLVNPKKLSGMYNKFFKQANITKVYGLTGTPYRQDTYYKEPPEGWALWKMKRWKNYKHLEVVTTTKMIVRYQERFWVRMLEVVNTADLMAQNYLCPLSYTDATVIDHNEIPVNLSKSDFNWEAFDQLIQGKEEKIIAGIHEAMQTHKSVLVFCAKVEQAERMAKVFPESRVVSSDTPKREREQIVSDLKEGRLKLVFNCQIFTVGFDYPELDCIILARPCRSFRLHAQILGRGTRTANRKTHCDVIDYVGNVKALGTLESMKIEKINGLWNLTTSKFPEGVHMKPLFTFRLRPSNL